MQTETQEVDWREEHAKVLARFQDLHRWWVKCGIPVDQVSEEIKKPA